MSKYALRSGHVENVFENLLSQMLSKHFILYHDVYMPLKSFQEVF